jgi:choline dehydrogenase-like flavoprotein
METGKADVCIVGAGPVGLALALRLEELGLSVILLEMGNSHGVGPTEFENRRHAPPVATSRPGIGGASALWGGRCVAFDDQDFEVRQHVPFSGWPMRHEELAPFYPDALAFLKANSDDISLPADPCQRGPVITNALEKWSQSPDIGPIYLDRLAAARRIRLVPARATRIILDTEGHKVQGLGVESENGKGTISAGHYVLAGGGLENARLLLDSQRSHPHLFGGADGALGRFYQGHLTGYIAILHFDRPQDASKFLFQKDDKGFVFRRRFQPSPATQVEEQLLNCVFWVDAISVADPVHGSGALSLIYLVLKTLGLYRRLSKGLAPTARGPDHIRGRAHWRNILAEGFSSLKIAGPVLNMLQRRIDSWRMLFNPTGRYLLRYHAEQVPNPESRVVLKSGERTGAQSALSVDYRVVDQDIVSVLKAHNILDDWLRRTGLGRLEYLHAAENRYNAVLNQAFDGYHQIGLTRMAHSVADGVADADCRVFGVDNLYLGGSCLFPTGGHANPTLPAVALALRLAEHLAKLVGARESTEGVSLQAR